MKTVSKTSRPFQALLALALLGGALALPQAALASRGATDPIPGTSNGGVKSGGGKSGGSTTPAPAPTPAPTPAPAPQPILVAPLTFTANATLNGIAPYCTGAYRVDPYYPTLSLLTVSVNVTAAAVLDGTVLFVNVNGIGGTLYPFTSNQILIAGQAGTCAYSEYVTPGTVIQSVVITDAAGNVLLTGN